MNTWATKRQNCPGWVLDNTGYHLYHVLSLPSIFQKSNGFFTAKGFSSLTRRNLQKSLNFA